ncbi:MAG: hypothetical protein IID38_01700 [Planctomycetes bacterium]|nr:hypothetical protein [Planctomycetota bacterium]
MKRSLDRCIDPCAAIVAACLAFCAPLPGCTVIEPLQPAADAPAEDSATRPVSGLPTLLHEQTVAEGDIVILRAIAQPEVAGVLPTYVWLQVSGPVVELRGLFTPVSTFIAPVVDGDTLLVFRFFTIVDGTVGTQQSVVRVVDVTTTADAGLCDNTACPSGTECDPATGECASTAIDCENVVCDVGDICEEATGVCIPVELCGGQSCAADEKCNPDVGQCEPLCPEVTCGEGEKLNSVACACIAIDPCQDVACLTNETCNLQTGECETDDLCAVVQCAAGETCDPTSGDCIAVDECAGVSCPSGFLCDPQTGECSPEGGCVDPPAQAVFAIANTSVGMTEFTLTSDYWIEFDGAVDAATFAPELVEVLEAGADNRWGTSDDTVIGTSAQLDCCTRIRVQLAPQTGELLAGRRYRVIVSPGCLRVTSGDGTELGLDGEFAGTFPTGNGSVGGTFVQEFVGVASGEYTGDLVCDEETRDILGRVNSEEVHYDDQAVVRADGVLLAYGQPVRVGETMIPEQPGFDMQMVVQSVSRELDGFAISYDVSGTTDDGYAFDGIQEETYTFIDDGSIRHAGTSSFEVRSNRGGVVATFTRTCIGTLRR